MARCWMAEGRSKLRYRQGKAMETRKKHPPVSVDPTKELRPQIHVVEAMCMEQVSGPDDL
jgi:hypothetical protein